jgi:hypothetical protein
MGFSMKSTIQLLGYLHFRKPPYPQWEFEDPNMEVLYHIRPYFAGIFPEK